MKIFAKNALLSEKRSYNKIRRERKVVININSSWLFKDPGMVSPEARKRNKEMQDIKPGKSIRKIDDSFYVVYGLVDPRTEEPFYIGRGNQDRPKQSAKRTNSLRKGKNQVITELYSIGLEPKIKILEKGITREDSYSKEEFYIKLIGRKDLGLGPLLNKSDGGRSDRGKIIPEETRRRIGVGHRKVEKRICVLFYIPKEIKEELKIRAKKEHRSLSSQIRYYVSVGLTYPKPRGENSANEAKLHSRSC